MPILRFPDCQVHIQKALSDEISVVFKYDQGKRPSIVALEFSNGEISRLDHALQAVLKKSK